MSASEPPELPEPEVEYRRPAWVEPPADVVPGVVPVELILARTDTHAVLVDGLLVYPTGFDFDLTVRRRPGRPREYRHRPRLWDDELRLEVRFADGRSADNHPRRWPRTSGGAHLRLPMAGRADPTVAGGAGRRAGPGGGRPGPDPLARPGLITMSFFVMPAWQPPSGYRIPAWLRPPEAMVPGIVPFELLLARTATHAVLVTHLHAYPTGLGFVLTVRPHQDQLHQRRQHPDRPASFAYHDLWLELRFADGHTASNHPRYWPHTFETEQPDPPFLYCHGGGGSERGWHSPHWLWVLPRPAH